MSVAVALAADKSKGPPYKQFFACECGSRFNNEDELKIHFCLSHNGEKEVKVRVQRIYKKLQSPKQTKNEPKTPAVLPGPAKISPVKIEKANPNKIQMKIVSVQEENSNAQIVRQVTPIKEEKTDYKKVYEELNQFAKQNDTDTAKSNYRTIQYPKTQGVTLYKSEPLEPNVVHSYTNVVQKKNIIKPIVIPISQMKPNSYIIQQPVKKQPADTNIQVFKCGDNKFLVRNNSPNRNTVSLQQSDGKPVYVINGKEPNECYQNVIVEENSYVQMETNHEPQTQYVGIKRVQETYQEYVLAEDQTLEYAEEDEQEVKYEQEEYLSEHVTEEYITDDYITDDNDGEDNEEEEEQADYDNLLEAHEVETLEAHEVETVTEEKPPRKKPKKYKHKPAKEGDNFPCTICERAFTKPMSLTQHLIQVHRPRTGIRELRPSKLLNRKRITYEQEKEEKVDIKCDMCDREFYGIRALTVHRVKAHLGTAHIERPYQCEHCEKSYRNQTLLTYHMRIHTGERPYKCTYCPKGFTMKQGLESHLKSHTGECPFQCRTCGKRVKSKFSLVRHHQQWHERTHTGERPYICRKCGNAFKCQTTLLRHEKVHTGEKPYACPHCQKCFSQSNSMKLHVLTVHMKQPAPYKSRKRKEKEFQRSNEEAMKKEEPNEEDMEVYFGSEDDAAGYEEVYA